MATNDPSLTISASTNGIFRIVVLTVSTVGTTISNVAEHLYLRARRIWRDWVEEPLLQLPIEPCPPILAGERLIARSSAPLMFSEPAFVGAGPMLRRWR